MALTADQVVWIRRKIGTRTPPTDGDLDEIFDRVGTVEDVAKEVLETRLATLLSQPESFSVSGEYSQSTKGNIEALRALLDDPDLGTPSNGVRIVSAESAPGR